MPSRSERANAIRALAMDAVQRASSGHPGAPMGLADVAEVLFREVVRHNPGNPAWIDRDRFVLSNGHGSMLLYAVLHLTGYGVTIDDLKQFRQLHSNTPGHPERGETPGVETTTGPLGQGFANAVGMAIAERELARTFNRPGHEVIDHRTWVIVGDGCLMEGVSHEAASLAGTLRLGKLKALWDDNGISIDGETKGWFSEDVGARFEAYGWRVIRGVDGHDPDSVAKALADATSDDSRPTLVCVRTVIGFGAPNKEGTAEVHGAALGESEVSLARRRLNWGYPPFEIPTAIYAEWDGRERGAALERRWQTIFDAYAAAHPELARELMRRMNGALPERWDEPLLSFAHLAQAKPLALETRKSSQACLDAIGPTLPELIGGSADLTGSNNTQWKGAITLTATTPGNYLHFGVREFAMTAITSGLALHGGFVPYSGTFLVFMEYACNAVRLAALMRIRNVFVYTHDSVGLGEDGPTHQPVEQLTTLRATPNLSVWRPCDTVETAFAWRAAIARAEGPTALVLTRQKTSPQTRDARTFDDVARGGYVLVRERAALAAIVVATGSEVEIAVAAVKALGERGAGVRVVSMPSTDAFLAQGLKYREAVLPSAMRARVAVEAAHSESWFRFVGLDGKVVSIDRYGLSAPGAEAMKALGISVESVAAAVTDVMGKTV
jgi:transketolase